MRIIMTLVAGTAALLLACCDPSQEYKYYNQGIGTELDSSTITADTQLQSQYLSDLCEQAGLSEAPCLPATVSKSWGLVVQAGMNDIDQRCDAFLGWLDEKRRNQEPILNELHTVAAATQAIMNVAGVGANPITIVALAFGLASDTFTNVRSSLLLEVDKSTVETIVINAQNRYRAGLASQAMIDNRAAAVYALRSYLRICTPFTIANQINTTVTLVERGASSAVLQTPMVNAKIVRTATITSATAPITVPAIPNNPSPGAIGPFENSAAMSPAHIKDIQNALCVDPDGILGSSTRTAIGDYLVALGQPRSTVVTSRVNSLLERAILKNPSCSAAGFKSATDAGKALAGTAKQ